MGPLGAALAFVKLIIPLVPLRNGRIRPEADRYRTTQHGNRCTNPTRQPANPRRRTSTDLTRGRVSDPELPFPAAHTVSQFADGGKVDESRIMLLRSRPD